MDNKLSAFITLDDVVKQYLIDIDAVDTKNYNRAIAHAMRGYNELEWDVLKKFTARILPVNATTKTVTLPEDFVQYTRIGFKNQVGEVIDLTYDPNLVTEITSEDCHCNECGCNNEICASTDKYSLTKSEIILPTEQKVCDYTTTIEFVTEICDYSIDLSYLDYSTTTKFTSYTKDGTVVSVNQLISSDFDLDSIMVGLGFTITGYQTYSINQYNVWNSVKITTNISCDYNYDLSSLPFEFPYTIQININGTLTPVTPTNITNQSDLDTFFSGYGFTKISDTSYTVIQSSNVYYEASIIGVICTNTIIDYSTQLQTATYLPITEPINFTGISVNLGGVLYADGSTYTSVAQVLQWLNSLDYGIPSFSYDGIGTITGTVNSNLVGYFSQIIINTAGTPIGIAATNQTSNTNTITWDTSSFSYPLVDLKINIDGVVYSSSDYFITINNINDIVTFINMLPIIGVAVELVNDYIIILYNVSVADISTFTFPATDSFTITADSIVYSAPLPIASIFDAVQWMNTLGLGEFGLYGTDIYYKGANSVTEISEEAPSCTNAIINASTQLQTATYLPITQPINFTGISANLGGVLYADGSTYTSVAQVLQWLNSLDNGSPSFSYDGIRTITGTVNSNLAGYFSTIIINTAGTPIVRAATNQTSNTNTITWDTASFVYPLSSLSVDVDGVVYSTTTINNISNIVTFLNTLPIIGVASTFLTYVVIRHYVSTVNISTFTFPATVSFSITADSIVYNAPTPIVSAFAAVQWMNTLGLGEFGLYGTDIYYKGGNNVTNIASNWGSGSASFGWSINQQNGAYNLVTILEGCNIVEQIESFVTNQGGGAYNLVTDLSSCNFTGETISSTQDNCGTTGNEVNTSFIESNCVEDNTYYGFPFTITSLLINGVTNISNRPILSQQNFEDIFGELGFDITSNNIISIENSAIIYENISITDNKGEETTIYFLPSSCSIQNNDVTYEKKVTTCLSGDKVTTETCAPVLINSTFDLYDYSVDFSGALGLPTEVLYNKDGQEYSLGVIDTLDELYTELIALGWGLVSYDDAIMVLIGSENIWGDFEFVDTPLLVTPDTIFEYQSVNVVDKCSTQIVCELEVLECGCIVPTDEVINTLYAANLIDNAMFQRYINGGEISTTWRQPMNAYGFYNVDVHKGIIKLDPFFRYDAIYLEYYTSSNIQSKDFLVPVLAREYLISYIHKMSILRKNNAPLWQIEKAQKQARAEKHNLRLRWQPIRYREIVDLFRTTSKS